VRVTLEHGTTDDADVAVGPPWAPSGSGGGMRLLTFEEGVVSLTFRISVFDDALIEPSAGEAARAYANVSAALLARDGAALAAALPSSLRARDGGLGASVFGAPRAAAGSITADGDAPALTASDAAALALSAGGRAALAALPAPGPLDGPAILAALASTAAASITALGAAALARAHAVAFDGDGALLLNASTAAAGGLGGAAGAGLPLAAT
jgi:hypothetical protein